MDTSTSTTTKFEVQVVHRRTKVVVKRITVDGDIGEAWRVERGVLSTLNTFTYKTHIVRV